MMLTSNPLALTILDSLNWGTYPVGEVVECVEFPADDAYFLAGPFQHEGKFYGMVNITHSPDELAQAELLERARLDVLTPDSDSYMPYTARNRLRLDYPNGMGLYYDEVTKTSYSELDLKVGVSEIPEDIQNRLVRSCECAPFFQTKAAQALVMSDLTPGEREEWLKSLEDAAARVVEEMRATSACKELPYRIYLYGNDDASWTTVVASEVEVQALLADLRARGVKAVQDRMLFTN